MIGRTKWIMGSERKHNRFQHLQKVSNKRYLFRLERNRLGTYSFNCAPLTMLSTHCHSDRCSYSFSALYIFDSTLPWLVQELFEWNTLGAGLIFLLPFIPTFLGPVAGAISDHYGPKQLAAGGFLLAVPFLVCLQFVTFNDVDQKVLLCVMLAGVGFALMLVFSALIAEITWVVEEEEKNLSRGTFRPRGVYAQAYSLYSMAFSIGARIGPIVGGMVERRDGAPSVGVWRL